MLSSAEILGVFEPWSSLYQLHLFQSSFQTYVNLFIHFDIHFSQPQTELVVRSLFNA
jgi:hypothetical protein